MFHWLLTGALIGFSIAMPVGPIGLLCIRNALHFGCLAAFVTGLGAAAADAVYGAAAGFGVAFISNLLDDFSFYMQAGGALFLIYMGMAIFFSKPAKAGISSESINLYRIFYATFFLTLANPLTILSFAGIYAGMGIGSDDLNAAWMTTLGVFLGSISWWLILSFGTALFKHKMNERTHAWLNRASGFTLLCFGLTSIPV